ncbi:hypothetical protein CCP4SC76_7750003 [Gammaproteobacteria bacterium]
MLQPPLTGRGRFVFPGARGNERPMSDNAILAAMRRMGIKKEEMSGLSAADSRTTAQTRHFRLIATTSLPPFLLGTATHRSPIRPSVGWELHQEIAELGSTRHFLATPLSPAPEATHAEACRTQAIKGYAYDDQHAFSRTTR